MWLTGWSFSLFADGRLTSPTRACDIEVKAYANNAASPFLFPGPFPPDSLQQRVNAMISDRKSDSTIRYIKAVDELTGEQIAFAKWHFYATPAAAAEASRAMNLGPGCNKEACQEFFSGLQKRKKVIMEGRAHAYLHLLHCDPIHQGRGAGGLLMQWGAQKADALGLPTYLESSPDAHRFYLQHGFKDIEVFSLHLGQFGGGNISHDTPLMIRETSASSS
ncbi:hypothetical protein EJ04DRAFT_599153 [Polyplosphaeria fusca]|uniref:N-acetyltransferase domain-containing protein n=1 Tax=Polyplosphaeria fusca TaxID=682080 RepID=A0A9P4QFY0_9PLEO|nr:hypothetical protein EJ04DRAFT_599153 [Polyplosphaeria fusca]